MPNLERKVVCAACRIYGDTIICGARHWDSAMRSVVPYLTDPYSSENVEQGFINTWGEFLTREEAWLVAKHNNQIVRRVGGDMSVKGGKLFSENLY